MADKADTYYCQWRREPDGTCTGWEIRRPKLRAQAASPAELMRTLGDIVGEHYDDHEAALHFDPPLSEAGDPAWFADGMMSIAWNAGFEYRDSMLTAYTDGRCDRCGGGLGPRTAAALTVNAVRDSTDGASSRVSNVSNAPPPCYGMPGKLMIVSEAFLKALSDQERATFDARPVKWATGKRRQFFELVPHAFIPLGAIKGLGVNGWRCDRCGRRVYSHGSLLGWGVDVVCRQHLPANSRPFFFAGSDKEVHLFCTRERWKRLAGKRFARKLTGNRLAVVDESQFETNPLLGTLDEIAAFRREFGFKVPFKPRPPG